MPELLPGLQASDDTLARLRAYDAALARWSSAINLIAPATLAESWQRHILDSAQLFSLLPESARHWADLGAGGGLPGLVIAILARGMPLTVTLVEATILALALGRATGMQPSWWRCATVSLCMNAASFGYGLWRLS